jgi:hypothetical protein
MRNISRALFAVFGLLALLHATTGVVALRVATGDGVRSLQTSHAMAGVVVLRAATDDGVRSLQTSHATAGVVALSPGMTIEEWENKEAAVEDVYACAESDRKGEQKIQENKGG